MPALYDPDQVERLITSNAHLDGNIDELKSQLRFVRWVTFGVTALLLLTIAAGVSAVNTYNGVRHLQRQQTEERAQNMVASCVQYNVQREQERNALVGSLLKLVPPGTTLTDAQKQIIAAYNAEVAVQLPYRDCSPEGIDAYFKDPPVDPAK